jgi:50S ribosomal subunit-associated GTPase HflX
MATSRPGLDESAACRAARALVLRRALTQQTLTYTCQSVCHVHVFCIAPVDQLSRTRDLHRVVVNAALSGVQHRNLEQALG